MNERHRLKRLTAWRYVLALPRSIWFNFRHLPLRQAWHLPVLLSHHTVVESAAGSLVITCPELRIGLVKIGFSTYQQTDFRFDRTRLNLRGKLLISGECDFGAGSCLHITDSGVLTVGKLVHIGPKSLLLCNKGITLGDRVLMSWCCTLMDTDQHNLIDSQGRIANADREIVLGENVWVGCHSLITKGTRIAPNCTIGAGSVVHGRHEEPRTVLAGNPAQIVKRDVMLMKSEL